MHSLTGASSAKRWMNCSGYLHLAQQEGEPAPERLDPEYTREGTAGHLVAAWCLKEGKDAWEFTGREIEGVTIGEGDGQVSPTAIQEFIDVCRKYMDKNSFWIEEAVSDAEHPGFYGTLDFGALYQGRVKIVDLKMGQGVFVDVIENEQCMYYAYGLLRKLGEYGAAYVDDSWSVDITIVQPRFWNYDGPRTWTTTVGAIRKWGDEVLLPDIERRLKAAIDAPEYIPGEHCRFCPVKLKCPVMRGMFGAAVANARVGIDPKAHTDAELGLEYSCIPQVKMYIKGLEDEVNFRATSGRKDSHWKVVQQVTKRVWKDGAMPALRALVGDFAMEEPKLKSPAQMEKIGDFVKPLVAEWAFQPRGNLVAAHVEDGRSAEKALTIDDVFSHIGNA